MCGDLTGCDTDGASPVRSSYQNMYIPKAPLKQGAHRIPTEAMSPDSQAFGGFEKTRKKERVGMEGWNRM